MEHKEKQKVYAQTFVPSVERFHDNPSLIQLASKAKDSNLGEGNDISLHRRLSIGKKSHLTATPGISETLNSSNISSDVKFHSDTAQRYLSKNVNSERTQQLDISNQKRSIDFNSNTKDMRLTDSISPRFLQDVKHGFHDSEKRQKCSLSKSLSPDGNQRQITSISACTWTPGSAHTDIRNNKSVLESQLKEHNSCMEPQTRNDTLSMPEDKLDSKDVKQSSRFFRSFPAQTGRASMKHERNQKLPVGIAVARQRQHAGPTKLRTTAAKNTSPELERRYHEHALNQEREVLLRENKELSNYTSRLQTSTASSLPLLNLQSGLLPAAWEREQALMTSSLLQWQAQQQSLLNSSLQHPSMWLPSPYAQTGTSLPTGPTPLLPGGFVIMPQILQESAMTSMWPHLALYGNSHPASRNISNTFQDLLSRQLQNLQHHELQALQQQALMQQGVSLPMRKSETPVADDQRQSSTFVPKRKTEIGRTSPFHRSVSPKTSRRESIPNWSHEEHRHISPIRSPTKTPSLHQSKTPRINTPESSKSSERRTISASDIHRIESSHLQDRKLHNINNSKQAANISNTQVFDLTSGESFDAKSHSKIIKNDENTAVYAKPNSPPSFHVPTTIFKEEKLNSDENNNIKITMKQPCNVVTKTHMQKNVNLPNSVNTTLMCSADDTKSHMTFDNTHDSSGVELLTKAADIHIKHMSANLDFKASTKIIFSERDETINNAAQNVETIDISTIDPEVLDAVRGITLLSQSLSGNQRKITEETSESDINNTDHIQSNINDCNDDVQSTVSFSSITDSTIISGDCMSGSELKEHDIFEKVKLRRKLKRPISATLKYCKEEDLSAGAGIKLDSMGAMEVDMRSRLADLQRRYKEKQKELAKIQRKNRRDKHDSNTSTSSTAATPTTAHSNNSSLSHHHSPSPIKFKFPETSTLSSSSHAKKISKTTIAEGMFSSKRKKSSDSEKDAAQTKNKLIAKQHFEKVEAKSLFEKFQFEALSPEKLTAELNPLTKVHSDDLESEVSSDQQQIPSGSRKRKTDKPKRICIPPGERPTVPLVEPVKKSISSFTQMREERKSEKKRRRKMKQASKKMKIEQDSTNRSDSNMIYSSSWVFKSNSKSEKHEKKQKKSEGAKKKADKANNANLSNNNNKRKKSRSRSKETTATETETQPIIKIESDSTGTPRLELREEDLVKGLQVLVPLEDKLLYLCQINPIQPPDIYEVTVEGERHRHRPNVMCLEQILKEAVPDVKPRSSQDLCEGSRVAAYWSHKMHCLYTGTISFDDSDDEDDYVKDENTVQVEFDDGDSSMIPLEDIRLLPSNYPIMQPDAPFMMHYINRRRTSEISTKEVAKNNTTKNKKGGGQATDKKDKTEEKPRKKSEKTSKQKRLLDLSAYDYPINDDVEQPLPMPRKRASPTKINRKSITSVSKQKNNEEASSSAQSSSAEEDSDTVFSDSSDDTYDGDDIGRGSISKVEEKRIPLKHHKYRSSMSNHSNELWNWYDDDTQKKEPVKGRARKIYHKSIRRGSEVISCGDSAVFLSAGRPNLPYIGRIESMWESWGNNMVVKVRWFYHPEETKRGRLKSHGKHPLYKSSHIDENDVQTISHKCEVVSFKEYNRRMRNDEQNVFYCTGNYDPATCQVLQEHSEKRKHQKS